MSFIYVFEVLFLAAYSVQIAMGMKQVKHSNQNYQELQQLGKVAIGRRAGKLKIGTIILSAAGSQGKILIARKI